jgi:hypothetical protein
MNRQRQQTVHDLVVFCLLVAIGVTGRWGQPVWEFTPIAAATIFAGYHFSRALVAVLVPLATLAIGDVFLLPAHDNVPVIVATYGAMTIPVWLGRRLRSCGSTKTAIWRWLACGFVPATIFWVVTNFAVWAFQSDYEKTLLGLGQCYWAAIPFYRWMLAGDVFYLAVLASCWMLAGVSLRRRQPAPQSADRIPSAAR